MSLGLFTLYRQIKPFFILVGRLEFCHRLSLNSHGFFGRLFYLLGLSIFNFMGCLLNGIFTHDAGQSNQMTQGGIDRLAGSENASHIRIKRNERIAAGSRLATGNRTAPGHGGTSPGTGSDSVEVIGEIIAALRKTTPTVISAFVTASKIIVTTAKTIFPTIKSVIGTAFETITVVKSAV